MSTCFGILSSPLGDLYIAADDKNVKAIVFKKSWGKFKSHFDQIQKKENKLILRTKKQLTEYFSGKRRSFDIPFKLEGTPFQTKVWSTLAKVPYGETRSYKQQAQAIKSPNAVRAVGSTNGRNPLCIVLPCHRIVGSDGSLTGYAGGLKAKKFLLSLEK